MRWDRRQMLQGAMGAGTAAAVGNLAFLNGLEPVSAEEAKLSPQMVSLRADIAPLVRLVEDTPRDQLLEKVAAEIRRGTSYRQLLAAVMLAGVRGIRPRPVGFKFHAVLVINSAHLAAMASPDTDRWLPLFWALDQFKASQEQNSREGNWRMPPADEAALPPAAQARERFTAAMDRWDEAGADAAVTQLVRSAGAAEMFEIFARYGTRDFRDIGHKAIYTANSYRTLQAIGWEHAEPVLRSLAFALLEKGATKGNPAELDEPADRPGRQNLLRVKQVKPGTVWAAPSGGDTEAKGRDSTAELMAVLRSGSADDAAEKVVELVNRGAPVNSLWDSVLAGAGELLMRKPGLVGIHCVTTANALRYAGAQSGSNETRMFLLLQGAAFMTMFRDSLGLGRGGDQKLEALEPAAPNSAASSAEALEGIFAEVSHDRPAAARKTLAYLKGGGSPEELMTAARRLVFLKGNNAHDYKFSAAALEDYYHLGPAYRDLYLATSMFNLRGSQEPDNPLVARTRAALKA